MGEVVDSVARLVVVDVVGDTRFAAEPLSLLLGLELLGAGEEPTCRYTILDEGGVVGAAVELGGDMLGADALEVVFEVGLENVGAGRPGQVEGVPVSIINTQYVVWTGDLEG